MRKHTARWVSLGLLAFCAQALGASTGPLTVEDLTGSAVTAGNGSSSASSANPASSNAPSAGTASTVPTASGQAAGSDGLMVIMQQLQEYQQQLDQMRGQVEELRHDLDEMKSGAKDRYLDLDTRLRALETKTQTSPEAPAAATAAPAVDSQADQAAYVAARNKLLTGDHQGAATALAAYLKTYPKGQYVADAHYWLGEVYRIEGDKPSLQKASEQFSALIQQFPKDNKVPAALYKLATVQAQQGQIGQAKVALHRILQQYPNSNEAKLAAQLLKAL